VKTTILILAALCFIFVACENTVAPVQPQTEEPSLAMAEQGDRLEINAAGRGHTEKATGDVMFYNSYPGWDPTGQYFHNIFNAHETGTGKGSMTSSVIGFTTGLTYRVYECDVKYVNVNGSASPAYAYFAGMCTSDTEGTLVGKWLVVKVEDGGTPGSNGDRMRSKWAFNESEAEEWVIYEENLGDYRDIEIGNLQVHYYEYKY
jgi:hypothetical protein